MASHDPDFATVEDAGVLAEGGGGAGNLLHAIGAQFLAERERWPLWFPVLMGIGIGVYFWLESEPPRWLGAALLAASVAFVATQGRARRMLAAPLALFAVSLGFAAAQFETALVAAPVLDHRLGAVTLQGRIVSVDPLPQGARLVIAPARIERLDAAALPARVRVRLRHGDAAALPGAWVALKAVLMPPPAPALPGAYDFERRAWFDRIGAVGYALGAPNFGAAPAGEGASTWRVAVQGLRAAVTQRIRAALPDPTGAVAAALITGDTHAIPPDLAGSFRNAGLAHILVIAGLHMGMVAGIVFFALRAASALVPCIALYHPTKKYAAAGALIVTFGYMLLSGATVSSRRAFVMIALALIAIMVDRLSLSARAVAFAAVAIMVMTPESAAGPSFQMSFAAVAALIACYEALRPTLGAWHIHAGPLRRGVLYLFGIAVTTLVTTLATMPFTIYHFNRFPLYSVAANAVAVPITGFWVMPWAIVACLLMPLHLEAWALAPMSAGIAAIAAIARNVTAWPGAIVTVASMPAASLAALSFGGVWLCIWLGRWRWLGLAPMAAGYLAIAFERPPDLFIAGEDNLVAVRAPDGSYLPSSARDVRAAEEATRRFGTTLGVAWPESGSTADGALTCDAAGCLYRARGRIVALTRDGAALAEDCAQSDLVVASVAAHRLCRGPRVIDRIDIWRKGGHEVWLDPDRVRIATVRDWQGERPWVPQIKSAREREAEAARLSSGE